MWKYKKKNYHQSISLFYYTFYNDWKHHFSLKAYIYIIRFFQKIRTYFDQKKKEKNKNKKNINAYVKHSCHTYLLQASFHFGPEAASITRIPEGHSIHWDTPVLSRLYSQVGWEHRLQPLAFAMSLENEYEKHQHIYSPSFHLVNPLATVHLKADNPGFWAVTKSARGPVWEPARMPLTTADKIGAQAPLLTAMFIFPDVTYVTSATSGLNYISFQLIYSLHWFFEEEEKRKRPLTQWMQIYLLSLVFFLWILLHIDGSTCAQPPRSQFQGPSDHAWFSHPLKWLKNVLFPNTSFVVILYITIIKMLSEYQ